MFEGEGLEVWEAQFRPILNPLRELVDSADSFEELKAGREALIARMDAQRLVKDLATAFFNARAARRRGD